MDTSTVLKVVTLNIEGNKHLERALPFLVSQNADVVCLQEVFGVDIVTISEALGMEYHYVPTMHVSAENKYNIPTRGDWGVALLTKLPHQPFDHHFYKGTGTIPEFVEPNSGDRVVVTAQVTKGDLHFFVATTHFTWSGKGEVHPEQLADFAQLAKIVAQFPPHILCGDFNAPRGGEMFSHFLEMYKDAMPQDVKTTIDGSLHYAGALELVVDTFFYTPPVSAKVTLVTEGVSDHKGVTAEVTLTE